MYISTQSLVLAALAVAEATAASVAHGHSHNARHAEVDLAARHLDAARGHRGSRNEVKRDLNAITEAGIASLKKIGVGQAGLNYAQKNGLNPWIGADGQFTNDFINTSGEDLHLVIWGPAGSWVNTLQPQITVSIPKNGTKTLSFPVGWSGAWAPVYASTKMVNGQISDTWGEGTFAPPYSVVDVSREVNMNGRNMKIVGPQCTSDMNTCVFKCGGGESVCTFGYKLENCATGSQPGAYNGQDWNLGGAASGGCGGIGDSAKLKTYLG